MKTILLKIECRGCGYTLFVDKKGWEALPEVKDELDCLNPDCQYYGKGLHYTKSANWIITEIHQTPLSLKSKKQEVKEMANPEEELAEQMETANYTMRILDLMEKAKKQGPKYFSGYQKGFDDGSNMAQWVIIKEILDEAEKDPQFKDKMMKIMSAPKRLK